MTKPPEQYEVTNAQFWAMWANLELKEYISADHIVAAIKKVDNEPVWTEYHN